MRPGQVHQLTLKAGSIGYLMEFKNNFYYPHDKSSNHFCAGQVIKAFVSLIILKFKKLLAILSYIFQEYTEKQEGYHEVIKANLGIFFIELLRHRQNRKAPTNNAGTYTQERLEEFLELLETHIAEHKQVLIMQIG